MASSTASLGASRDRAARVQAGWPRGRQLASGLALLLAATVVAAVVGASPARADGVTRLEGPDRFATAAAISRSTFDPGIDTAWVVSGATFADALAVGPLAGRDGGPILLANRTRAPAATITELERVRPRRIVLVGGTSVLGPEVAQQLRVLAPVERVAGADRHHTAAAVAREGWPTGADVAWLVDGADFPDALAAGPAAARGDAPILLTEQDRLPPATEQALRDLTPDQVVVAGGTAAVSDAVVAEVDAIVGTVERRAGPDRYATARAISARSTPAGADPVYVASGRRWPDALAATPMAVARGTSVLLTRPRAVPPSTAAELDRLDPSTITVLGGSGAVEDPARLALLAHADLPSFSSSTSTVDADRLGASWRPGCPVSPSGLRLLRMSHVRFDGSTMTGELVVATGIADDVRAAFRDLYHARFPIRRMRTVEVYGADDDASMAADNTSAFNCRAITGGTAWSRHSSGTAIDVNPRENPYVRGSTVLPPQGRAWLDRSDVRPGMLVSGSGELRAFTDRGFTWGGDWTSLKDYQHVER